MNNTNTIVSAFVANANSQKGVDFYINKGKSLLQLDINKIIFIDSVLQNKYNDILVENDNTRIIYFNKNDLYLYNYIDKITNFSPNTGNTCKDTLEYFVSICLKTEFVRMAIELNLFNTTNYLWLDLGIQYVCVPDLSYFTSSYNCIYEKVRIAGITGFHTHQYEPIDDILKNVKWYFAGGVFGGNQDKLLLFADLVKQKCIEIIEKYNTLTWEVNIWYLVYFENKELFDWYKCGFNTSIITNY